MLGLQISALLWTLAVAESFHSDPCLPNDSSELARILTHCHEFYTYYQCAQDNRISYANNTQWAEIVENMLQKCQKYISDVESVPQFDINLKKMASVLQEFVKPAKWDPCNNFHAYTCEHSPRLSKRGSPMDKRTDKGTYGFGRQDIKSVNATLDKIISKNIKSLSENATLWTGPLWVKKLLIVLSTCEENGKKDLCKEIDSLPVDVFWPRTDTRTTQLLKKILYLYYTPHLPGYYAAKNFTEALVPLIIEETAQMVQEWAGAGDTTNLIKFVKDLKLHIGIKPENFERLDNITSALNVESGNFTDIYDSFFNWWIELYDMERMEMFRGLGLVWNAYTTARGDAYFGGTLLAPPAFDLDLSYAFLFGDTLFVLFHEVAHNLQFIMRENKHNMEGFYSYFHDCLVEEYGKLPVYFNGSELLNGTWTYSENFADVIGLLLTWRFYQKYYKHKDQVPEESGFTKDQVFFAGVSSNAIMCDPKWRDQNVTESRQEKDPHTIGENRLNLLLMHSPAFARVFNCTIGSRMNPYKNCVKLLDLKTY